MNRDFSFGQKRYTYVDRLAEKFRYGKVLSFLKNKYPDFSNLVFCDVGCGFNANMLLYLLNEFKIKRPFGVDMEINSEICNKINFIESDLENAEFKINDEEADIITSIAVIEHLNNPARYLEEIYRILKPGGYFLLTTPNTSAKPVLEFLAKTGLGTKEEIMDHKLYYNVNTLNQCLEKNNFKNINLKRFSLGLNIFCNCSK